MTWAILAAVIVASMRLLGDVKETSKSHSCVTICSQTRLGTGLHGQFCVSLSMSIAPCSSSLLLDSWLTTLARSPLPTCRPYVLISLYLSRYKDMNIIQRLGSKNKLKCQSERNASLIHVSGHFIHVIMRRALVGTRTRTMVDPHGQNYLNVEVWQVAQFKSLG